MQTILDLDADLLARAESVARQHGQTLSAIVEKALRSSLNSETPPAEVYGEPLTDEDIAEAARVTFAALDADESKA